MDNDLVNDIDMVEEERYINIKDNDDTTIETIEEQKMTTFRPDKEKEARLAQEKQMIRNAMIQLKTNSVIYNGKTYTVPYEDIKDDIEKYKQQEEKIAEEQTKQKTNVIIGMGLVALFLVLFYMFNEEITTVLVWVAGIGLIIGAISYVFYLLLQGGVYFAEFMEKPNKKE